MGSSGLTIDKCIIVTVSIILYKHDQYVTDPITILQIVIVSGPVQFLNRNDVCVTQIWSLYCMGSLSSSSVTAV